MTVRHVIVVGGGPAGLMAAGQAAELGAKTVLLEKMNRTGRKLRITGKGRCNLTNIAPEPILSRVLVPTGASCARLFPVFSVEI